MNKKMIKELLKAHCTIENGRWVFKQVDIDAATMELEQAISAKPIVSGALPLVDWTILRQKYFSDCTIKDSVDGLKLRIDYAPHDLFEWFKREIQFGGNDR